MLEKNETKLWDSAPRALIELSAIHYHASFDTENANSPKAKATKYVEVKFKFYSEKNCNEGISQNFPPTCVFISSTAKFAYRIGNQRRGNPVFRLITH